MGNVGLAVFGIFAGIFLGSWIIALGEVVDVFAILARRLKLHHSFPWVIAAIAAGNFWAPFCISAKDGIRYGMYQKEEETRKEYEQYVEQVTPRQNLPCI